MKYQLRINQASILQYNDQMNCNLDLKDAAIISVFVSLIESGKAKRDGEYYVLKYTLLINEPLLGLKTKQSVVKRYNKLIAAKVLHPKTESTGGNSMQYFKIPNMQGLKYYKSSTDFTDNSGCHQPALPTTAAFEIDNSGIQNRQQPHSKSTTGVDTYKDNNNKVNKTKVSSKVKETNDSLFSISLSLSKKITDHFDANPGDLEVVLSESGLSGDISKYIKRFVSRNLEMSDKSKKSICDDPVGHAQLHLVSFLSKEKKFNNISTHTYKKEEDEDVQISDAGLAYYKALNGSIANAQNVKEMLIKPLSKKEAELIAPGGRIYTRLNQTYLKREIEKGMRSVIEKINSGEILDGKYFDHILKEIRQ